VTISVDMLKRLEHTRNVSNMQSEHEYKAMLLKWGRKEILRLTRALGFSAQKLSTERLADLLWQNYKDQTLPWNVGQRKELR
jgi:hypothetical protein